MGFPGVIPSVPFMIDKRALKPPRESSVLRERRGCAGYPVPVVFCTDPKSTGPSQVRLSPWAFASFGDSLDKHSHTAPKLGCTALNTIPVCKVNQWHISLKLHLYRSCTLFLLILFLNNMAPSVPFILHRQALDNLEVAEACCLAEYRKICKGFMQIACQSI